MESILDAPHFLGWTCLVNTSASMAEHDHLNPWMDGTRPVDSGSSHSQQVLLFPQKARGEIETALQRCYCLLSTYSCASNNWLDLGSNTIWEKNSSKKCVWQWRPAVAAWYKGSSQYDCEQWQQSWYFQYSRPRMALITQMVLAVEANEQKHYITIVAAGLCAINSIAQESSSQQWIVSNPFRPPSFNILNISFP